MGPSEAISEQEERDIDREADRARGCFVMAENFESVNVSWWLVMKKAGRVPGC